MKVFAAVLLVVGLAALADREFNHSRYTDVFIKLSINIKRGFLG